jgi:transmembrane sensor
MSGVHALPNEADHRLNEAAAWRLRLTEAGVQSSMAFESWLGVPANRAAWEQVCRSWDMFDTIADAPQIIAARQAALADATRARTRIAVPRITHPLTALAAVLLIVLVAGSGYWWSTRPEDYQTAVGDRRVVTLSDGSKLSLDSNSEVIVRYAAHERALRLLRGQARFDVAHDRSRPFSVVAGSQRVIATGTAFNIDMAGPRVLVTLIEGRVEVFQENDGSAAGHWPVIDLRAGQQLVAGASSRPQVSPANIQKVTAWTIGQIMCDDEPLSSVVDRMNRYSNTQLVIADPRVGLMKISGVFNAGDASGFVEIVTRYLPVKAVPEGDHTIALKGQTKEGGRI